MCGLCPIDSKFTVLNEMLALYRDPRVELVTGASVQRVVVVSHGGFLKVRSGSMHR